jgi:hypothetical protein
MSEKEPFPPLNSDDSPANFCGECGLSLKPFDFICQSKECEKCHRRIYFQRKAPGGGYRFEEGEQAHISGLTMSLDPMEGGRKNMFFRPGLEGFLRQLVADGGFKPDGKFFEYCKKREDELDAELSSVEYLNHIDLNKEEDVNEAFEIIEREGATNYKAMLLAAIFFNAVQKYAKEGDIEQACESAFMAAIFVNHQLLENIHYKEIIWLGYQAYADLRQNEGMSPEEAREKLVVDQVAEKLKNLSDPHLLSLSQADDPLSVPLGVKGVREKGLRALVEHEVERRNKAPEEAFRSREVSAKESEQAIKRWHLYVVILALLVKVIYDYFAK